MESLYFRMQLEKAGRLLLRAMEYGLALLLVILVTSTWCRAQVDRSALSGTVSDASGRVLPETHIVVVQSETRFRREAVSQTNGDYSIPELPVGIYTITFDHSGFKTLTFVDMEQVIGRTRILNATLPVLGGDQRIEISASSEQMDRNTDALGTRIERTQAQELPLNGRNWATLTSLVPGAVDTGGSNQRSIRFAGRGRDDDNFTFDGIDATNVINQAQQPYVRFRFRWMRSKSFELTLCYRRRKVAEQGDLSWPSPRLREQTAGMGTFLSICATMCLMRSSPCQSWPHRILRFHLNQFGGSLGGPVVREKTFFFLALESYRQRWGFPLSGYVPSNVFRAQTLRNSPALAPIVCVSARTDFDHWSERGSIRERGNTGRQRELSDDPI
jgi:hypothetical protein